MKKKRRGKRKSRLELYRTARATKVYTFMIRIPEIVPGGNPFGLGEYTLAAARGPARA